MSTPAGSCICNTLALLYYSPTSPPTCVSCTSILGMAATCNACAPTGNTTGSLAACTSCDPGSYLAAGNCFPCTYPCSACITTDTTCTACEATYILSNNNCVCDNAHQIFENTSAIPNVCMGCSTLTTIDCL